MRKDHLITDLSILLPYADGSDLGTFPAALGAFIRHQQATWPELKTARANLTQSLFSKFSLTDLEVFVQHNPHRIKSSATRVDSDFIKNRPCFLCADRLYERQRALPYREEWLVLNNPFPIFNDHLVITHRSHLVQSIDTCLAAMAAFVRDTDYAYTAFYNGPACGASAPDHLHFQACPEGAIPITHQLRGLLTRNGAGTPLVPVAGERVRCYTGEFDGRGIFVCLSNDEDLLCNVLKRVVAFLAETTRSTGEPMINVMISQFASFPTSPQHPGTPPHSIYSDNEPFIAEEPLAKEHPLYMGILFPRKAHRPACYFKKGADKMLVSPGAVDIGGLIILPRRVDFDRMTGDLLLGIFSEVCYGRDIFKGLRP